MKHSISAFAALFVFFNVPVLSAAPSGSCAPETWFHVIGGNASKEGLAAGAVLAGHIHVTVADRFSPTAIEYVVGGNFLFHGQEITIT